MCDKGHGRCCIKAQIGLHFGYAQCNIEAFLWPFLKAKFLAKLSWPSGFLDEGE